MNISIEIELNVNECCNCGMPMYLTEDFVKRRRKDHKTFFCPMGHQQHYPAKSEEEKLKERLRAMTHERDIEQTRANNATKEAARLAARTRAGVCPCCNRTFKALAAHMKNMHKEFIA